MFGSDYRGEETSHCSTIRRCKLGGRCQAQRHRAVDILTYHQDRTDHQQAKRWRKTKQNQTPHCRSRHLLGMLYTVEQVQIEPSTYNSEENKSKRKVFAAALVEHQRNRDFTIYYGETNFNIYCHLSVGRSKKGTRAKVVLPPLKGPNLQVEYAVSATVGLVCYRLQRGSIKMDKNAWFVKDVYRASKASASFADSFVGKKIVIVLDNAPCFA
ncbi:hypothetical protein H257_08515 [Aphanomyces astaci]|uniref:Tc1-like transposase DDE domain-containing protein n=1 Tax=Aphanomyces astaci TaxID=112090 RepID=W4GEY5_APHAT|nr:hypothetical protein H257_08515 [Aphanomyces astaci]ETV77604.1 hypothetical protein H257_08515 [Aphanomyces astaci]|eukprot:XP_009832714.1 hypothetical protein H257_08515 [Aphanomyces astaci]